MYLFPYGWKVQGPATEESGLFVIKLVGLMFVLVITFDVILAWHIDAIDSGNHLMDFTFFALFIAIIACICAISRQPQIRYSNKRIKSLT